MVGVPRSTSCGECLQRRVKCDRTRPQCRRCQARGFQCPGYRRNLKFYNMTTGKNDFTDARTFDRLQEKRGGSNASSSSSSQSLALVSRPSIDDRLVPSLAAKALDCQTKEVFCYVVMATFPLTFTYYAPRLEPNWMDYIRYHQASQTEPIERALRCLNAWYLGAKNQDQEMINNSRYMYGGALRCLAGLVGDPRTRTADVTLATAIMLGVFEMLDGITSQSWLIHSRGIAELIRTRGARAHSDGFGRTMFITIRSFLLADAFVRRKPSFLGEREWRSANDEAIAHEDRIGKGSWLAKTVEQVFNEICLGPGFLSQTTAIITRGPDVGLSRDDLTSRIQQSRNVLRTLQSQLAAVSRLETNAKEVERLNGPIPMNQFGNIVKCCLQGISSGVALLDQLLVLLETDRKRAVSDNHVRVSEIAWVADQSLVQHTLEGPFSTSDRPMDWLDQISMSMGTLAITNNT